MFFFFKWDNEQLKKYLENKDNSDNNNAMNNNIKKDEIVKESENNKYNNNIYNNNKNEKVNVEDDDED